MMASFVVHKNVDPCRTSAVRPVLILLYLLLLWKLQRVHSATISWSKNPTSTPTSVPTCNQIVCPANENFTEIVLQILESPIQFKSLEEEKLSRVRFSVLERK